MSELTIAISEVKPCNPLLYLNGHLLDCVTNIDDIEINNSKKRVTATLEVDKIKHRTPDVDIDCDELLELIDEVKI